MNILISLDESIHPCNPYPKQDKEKFSYSSNVSHASLPTSSLPWALQLFLVLSPYVSFACSLLSASFFSVD